MRTSLVASFVVAAGLGFFAAATHGCSYTYEVILEVEIAADVAVPASTALVIVQGESAPTVEGRQPADAPWGVMAAETVTLAQDERTHRFEGATCCEPTVTNYAWAYLDLDGNGMYDAGEPYAADPGNPVEIDADYSVKLVIRSPG